MLYRVNQTKLLQERVLAQCGGVYPHLRFCDKDWRGVECRVGQECFTSVMREWFSAMDKYLLLLLLTITSEDDQGF